MTDSLKRTPQTRSAYAKALTLLLGVVMILGTVGLWAYGTQVRNQVTGAMNLAATLSPRRFVPAELLSKKVELDEAVKTSRSEADSEFVVLLKEHPVFGAPPQAGPPQAVITGILGDMALINNKWMKTGETQDGVKLVMTMTSGRALVEIEGKQHEVNIFTDMPNKPLPPGPSSLMGGEGGRGGRDHNSDRGGSGNNSTFDALRNAFASKKDIRNDKELMSRLSKMDNKDVYQLYQKAKATGVPLPASDQEIENFFRQGGFKNKKIYDEMENRGSGGGNSIPFGGSKSSSKADKKSAKSLDPDRLAEIKAAKAARTNESGPPKSSASEKPVKSSSPKSSNDNSFGAPERSGKGKSKKNRKGGSDGSPFSSGSSYTPPKISNMPPIAPPSRSSGMGSAPISGPPPSLLKSKSINSLSPSESRTISPKIPKASLPSSSELRSRSGSSISGSSRPDRPLPSELRSKSSSSKIGSSGSDRPSASELRSKGLDHPPTKPAISKSASSRAADHPSPSELRAKSGGSSSASPRPDRPSPSELRIKSGSSAISPGGSSKATRSFYPGSRSSKGGSSGSGFSGSTGVSGPKTKKGSRKVQSPFRNN